LQERGTRLLGQTDGSEVQAMVAAGNLAGVRA
jgi:hypothetical protein